MTDGKDAAYAPCPLRATAIASPDAPALVGAGETLGYGDLDRLVSAVAQRVRELSLGNGARVALYLQKDARYVALLLALIRAGSVACPLSTRVPPGGVAPLLRKAACPALVSEDGNLLDALGADVRGLRPEALLGDGSPRDRPGAPGPLRLPLDRPATIVFTSGSTGTPKAALHTFGNHCYSALGSNANIALVPGDRWLHSLPLYHVGGLSILFRCLLAGATILLPEPEASIGRAIARSGITHASLVATQLRRLLGEGVAPDGLKAILLGGSGIPTSLLDEAVARGLAVHTSYGLTEMASQVTTTPPGATQKELRTSGRVLPHREIRVARDGEILVRGETLFAGYVEGDRVERPLDAHGWFRTGDLGSLDAEGYLRVRGRKDNLFVSGGENVQPEEVEEVLCRLEGVEQAVVVPVEDEEFGARPVAFVRTAEGAAYPTDLAEELARSLPRFKIPVAFHGWPGDADPERMKPDRAFFRERARKPRRES